MGRCQCVLFLSSHLREVLGRKPSTPLPNHFTPAHGQGGGTLANKDKQSGIEQVNIHGDIEGESVSGSSKILVMSYHVISSYVSYVVFPLSNGSNLVPPGVAANGATSSTATWWFIEFVMS